MCLVCDDLRLSPSPLSQECGKHLPHQDVAVGDQVVGIFTRDRLAAGLRFDGRDS